MTILILQVFIIRCSLCWIHQHGQLNGLDMFTTKKSMNVIVSQHHNNINKLDKCYIFIINRGEI